VAHGQFEAAASQGLTTTQTYRHIVLPQVFRTIYAPLGNQFIAVILASSLASAVAVEDVASWMQTTGATSFRFFETFLVSAVVYLVLCQAVNLARLGIGRWLFNDAGAHR
jgi:ABC-type amino acid transport system permease subunit